MIHTDEDDEFERIERENKMKSSGMGCCTYDCVQGRDCPVRKAKWQGLTLEEYVAINQSCSTIDEAINSVEFTLKEKTHDPNLHNAQAA